MILEILLSVLVLAVIVYLVIMLWPKMMPKNNTTVYGASGSTPYDDFIANGVRYPFYSFVYPTYPTHGYNNSYYGDGWNNISGRNSYGFRSL